MSSLYPDNGDGYEAEMLDQVVPPFPRDVNESKCNRSREAHPEKASIRRLRGRRFIFLHASRRLWLTRFLPVELSATPFHSP